MAASTALPPARIIVQARLGGMRIGGGDHVMLGDGLGYLRVRGRAGAKRPAQQATNSLQTFGVQMLIARLRTQ